MGGWSASGFGPVNPNKLVCPCAALLDAFAEELPVLDLLLGTVLASGAPSGVGYTGSIYCDALQIVSSNDRRSHLAIPSFAVEIKPMAGINSLYN